MAALYRRLRRLYVSLQELLNTNPLFHHAEEEEFLSSSPPSGSDSSTEDVYYHFVLNAAIVTRLHRRFFEKPQEQAHQIRARRTLSSNQQQGQSANLLHMLNGVDAQTRQELNLLLSRTQQDDEESEQETGGASENSNHEREEEDINQHE